MVVLLIFTTGPEKGDFLLSQFSGCVTPASFSIQAVLAATLWISLLTSPAPSLGL